MRIHHVITRLIIGGAQENTILTCRGLAQRGHDVTLISGPETGAEGDLLDAARASGARLLVHPHLRRDVSPLHDALEIAALAACFATDRPHVVHTHSSKAGILGRSAARLAGVPVVVHTNHGLPFHDGQPAPVRRLYRALEQIASRMTDRVVCVGRDMVDLSRAAHVGTSRLFSVVRSGMDVDRFLQSDSEGILVRRRLGWSDDDLVVGTVARLVPQKGPRLFLEAITRLASRMPDLGFLWVGDGPLRDALERQAVERRLRVRFTGLVPPTEVASYLAAMDLVLMTSLWEGLPRVAVQAALSARPVVAFDAPGVREIVLDGLTGRVVARGDVQELAEAAEDVLRHPSHGRAFGQEGRRRFADEFRWEKMVSDLERLYSELLSARRGNLSRNPTGAAGEGL
ncbi:MAG: glycosyltransferase family 4 protein [Planctomycetes bacterium]|nr:glycosyltransferase family 4 protein [Planctomycetota bacterium]